MKKKRVVLELDEYEAAALIAALPDHGEGFPTLATVKTRLLAVHKRWWQR